MRICAGSSCCGCQLRQRVFVRGVAGLGFPERFQPKIFEEHRGQLLGRVDIEFTPGQPINAAGHVLQFALQFFVERSRPSTSSKNPLRSISASTGTRGISTS